MKSLSFKLLATIILITGVASAQNVGVGTLTPSHTLHIVVDASNPNQDPLKVENFSQLQVNDTALLILNPATGIVRYVTVDSLAKIINQTSTDDQNIDSVKLVGNTLTVYIEGGVNSGVDLSPLIGAVKDSLLNDLLWLTELKDSIDSDIDSVTFANDTIYIYKDGKVVSTYINTSLDTALVDSLIYAKFDSSYTYISDSLLNDVPWITELKDSIDSDIDSAILISDTALHIYEDGKEIIADISALKDSSEWVDGDLVGLTPGAIYARKSLARGDTVVIDTNGSLGIGIANPSSSLHINSFQNNPVIIRNNSYGHMDDALYNFIDFKDSNNITYSYIGEASTSRHLSFTGAYNYGLELSSLIGSSGVSNANIRINTVNNNYNKNAITFATKHVDRVIIDSIGRVGVGTTKPRSLMELYGSWVNSSQNLILLDMGNGNSGDRTRSIASAWETNGVNYVPARIDFGLTNSVVETDPFIAFRTSPKQVFPTNADISIEHMRITSDGNVGVGTTAPLAKLHVENGSIRSESNGFNIHSAFSYGDLNTTSAPHFIGYRARGTMASPTHPQTNDNLVVINGRNPLIPSSIGGGFTVIASENHSATNGGTKLLFYNTPNGSISVSTRMTIENNGNVGIGVINPISTLHVVGKGGLFGSETSPTKVSVQPLGDLGAPTVNFRGVIGFNAFYNYDSTGFISDDDLGSSNQGALIYQLGGGLNFAILPSTSGVNNQKNTANDILTKTVMKITSTAVYPSFDNAIKLGFSARRWSEIFSVNGVINTSDKRLKTNIAPLNYGLNEVLKLNTVSYNWKSNDNGTRLGFIAQELQNVLPEVVSVGEDSAQTLGVRYTEIIPVLTKAIQEQQVIIEELKSENEKLKADKASNETIEELKAENNKKELRLNKLESQLEEIQNYLNSGVVKNN